MFKNRVVKNSLMLVSEKVFRLVVGIFVNALVARYLAPELFGQLNLFVTWLSIITVVSVLGTAGIVVREINVGVNQREIKTLLASTFYLRLAFMSFGFLFVYLLILPDLDAYLYLIAISFLLTHLFSIIDAHQQATSAMGIVVLSNFIAFVVSSGMKLLLVYYGLGLNWFFAAFAMEMLVTSIIKIVLFVKIYHYFPFQWRYFDTQKSKQLCLMGLPLLFTSLGSLLFKQLDKIMLGAMDSMASVGIYSAASRISESLYFIPVAISTAAFAYVATGKTISHTEYQRRLSLLFCAITLISFSSALFFTFTADIVIGLMYGEKYLGSAQILVIHCWTGIFLGFAISSGMALNMEKLLRFSVIRVAIGLSANFILNLLLIDKYGTLGAAYSTLISVFIAFLLCDLFNKKLYKFFVMKIKSFNFPMLFAFFINEFLTSRKK